MDKRTLWEDLKSVLETMDSAKIADYVEKNVSIQRRLPALMKETIAHFIILDMENVENEVNDEISCMIQIECHSAFEMIKAYTNLKLTLDDVNYANYDLMLESGFYDLVYDICGRDFEVIQNAVKQARFNFTMNTLKEALGGIDVPMMNKGLEDAKEVFTNKDFKDSMRSIVDALYMNDPLMKELKDAIVDEATKDMLSSYDEAITDKAKNKI